MKGSAACPFFDQETSKAHDASLALHRTPYHRYPSDDPEYIIRYKEMRWKQRTSAPPSDKALYSLFVRQNPAIADAVARQGNTNVELAPPTDNSMDAFVAQELAAATPQVFVRSKKYDEYEREEDEYGLSDSGSDGDDWGSKRKGKKGKLGVTKEKRKSTAPKQSSFSQKDVKAVHPSTHRPPSPVSGPHHCEICRAQYKSKPGLIHHRAFWHALFPPPNAPPPMKLFSPNVDISTECDFCNGDRFKNAQGKAEDLVSCHDCGRSGHPSCLKFTPNMQLSTTKFGWQCIECKSCAICGTSENDDKLLFCDDCDRGFHLYCLRPALESAPEGEWSCHMCQRAFGSNASAPGAPPIMPPPSAMGFHGGPPMGGPMPVLMPQPPR
ncbi:unnamed protein product, partial [Mesorhabditis belari]|uniref:PHD-type domain-containing protein n=1 Tax=Mesorhabditis belari TaxID=2138241 RepID=A0AAF3J9F5_9BILA